MKVVGLGLREGLVGVWRRVEPIWKKWILVDTHVGGVPACETGTVALIVTSAEMEGDKTQESGLGCDVKELFRRWGLEERKIAQNAGIDEGRPYILLHEGRCREIRP